MKGFFITIKKRKTKERGMESYAAAAAAAAAALLCSRAEIFSLNCFGKRGEYKNSCDVAQFSVFSMYHTAPFFFKTKPVATFGNDAAREKRREAK